MSPPPPARRRPRARRLDAASVLDALPEVVLALDEGLVLRFVNQQAEMLLRDSAARLVGTLLSDHIPPENPLFGLVRQVLDGVAFVSQDGILLDTPRIGRHLVSAQVCILGDGSPTAIILLNKRSISQKIDLSLSHRGAARSVSAMAAMLAHEVKNPLSGIRGAAQLLEEMVGEQDRVLTRLICDEADRIVNLVNRMEVFSDRRPVERAPVNLHSVLEHVRRLAQNGFARHIRFHERYDPSLPPAWANRDQLVQVFLNLIKNASEAAPETGSEILLSTAWQPGARLAVPGFGRRIGLPLVVTIQDNGAGIPEDLQPHLFEPFVTTKANGTGLGLALVAKIIGDHGGTIEVESLPRRTVIKVSLPMFDEDNRQDEGENREQG